MTATTRKPAPARIAATDETAMQLVQAIKGAPRETTPAAQLIDRLQECGAGARAARKFVSDLVHDLIPMMEWPSAERNKFLRGTSVEAIQTALNAANGRRRERTLELADVLHVCKMARANAFAAWAGGGTVANNYNYRAEQTACVVAVGMTGKLRVVVRIVNASKGTSIPNQIAGINKSANPSAFRRWADQPTV